MDRYEYKELIDRVRGLIDRKDMEEAARQLDANNWRKVPSVNALMKAAELYEEVGRLDSAKELLMAAHERSPIGRMVIYRLALPADWELWVTVWEQLSERRSAALTSR